MSPLAPRPDNEIQRLAVLHELDLFDQTDDLIYRRKVDIMRRVFKVPIALLALADAEAQRFKVAFGLPMNEVARDLAICSHALVPPYPPLVIPDTTQDPRSADSPMVTGALSIRFYAGVPLVLDGQFAVGTLCIMDTAPRELDAEEIQLLADFAIQLAAVMQARLDASRLLRRTAALQTETETLRVATERERSVLRTVIDSTPSMIAAIDEQGRFTLANRAYAQALGTTPEQLIGQTYDAVMPQPLVQSNRAMSAQVREFGEPIRKKIAIDLNGEPHQVVITKALLRDEAGSERGIVTVVQDVTEFEALSAHLVQLQEIHRRGEAFAQQGAWSLDMRGGYMTISEGFAALLGFPVGTHKIRHTELRERIDPAYQAAIDAAFEHALAFKTVFRFDYPLADRTRGQQWLRARGDIVRDANGEPLAFVGVTQDVTEEVRAKALIEEQERLLAGLNTTVQAFLQQVDAAAVWQMMLDQLLAVTGAEFGFLGEVLFGIEATPCLKIHAITNLSWSAESDALYERVMAGNMLFCNPDNLIGAVMKSREPVIAPSVLADPRRGGFPPGHPLLDNYLGIPLYQGDALVGVVAIGNRTEGVDTTLVETLAPFLSTCAIMIVSLRQRAAQKDFERKLIESKEQAERANQSKSQFLSSMSHELRTPLNAILGFAQLMSASRREPLSDKQRGFVEQILKAGQHLLTLVNDVLNLAKIEAGEVTLSPEPLDLATLAGEACDMLLDTARSQQIRMNNQITSPQWVCADHTRARQILLNLMSNAVKYNRPQGSVSLTPLPARTTADGRLLLGLVVSDTGLGIPKDKQHRLFRAFERLGRENSAIEGTGIGLMITKQLVELMRGELTFESIENEGSRFFLWLPAYKPTQAEDCGTARSAPESATEATTGALTPSNNALRVLYIEDNAANRDLMAEIIEDQESHDSKSLISLMFSITHNLHYPLYYTHRQLIAMDEARACAGSR